MWWVAGIHHFLFDYEQESFNVISFSDVSGKKKNSCLANSEWTTRPSIHFPRWLESSLVMQGLLLLHTVNKFRLSTLLSRSEKNRGKDEAHTEVNSRHQWNSMTAPFFDGFYFDCKINCKDKNRVCFCCLMLWTTDWKYSVLKDWTAS